MLEKKIKNEVDHQYRLVGIATSLKEYKFCYHLNDLLGCDFRKLKDLIFEQRDRTRSTQFSVFMGNAEDGKNEFVVFTNKNLGEYLLPEVNNFDFVIRVSGKYEDEEIARLIEGIKQFPEVMMSAEIPTKKIKSRERLTYEEERPVQRLITTKKI